MINFEYQNPTRIMEPCLYRLRWGWIILLRPRAPSLLPALIMEQRITEG